MITLHYGTMNAGKSQHLLQQAFDAARAGLVVTCITQDGLPITSRLGGFREAVDINMVDPDVFKVTDVIYVDECQFLSVEEVIAILFHAKRNDCDVKFYGLKNKTNGTPWESTSYIFAQADNTVHHASYCEKCGAYPSTMHLHNADEDVIEKTNYLSVCHNCYNKQ